MSQVIYQQGRRGVLRGDGAGLAKTKQQCRRNEWARNSSSRDGHEANEAALHGAVARDEERWQDKVGRVEEMRARRAQEAWKQLRRARYRIPTPEMMERDVDPGEGHDDFLMSIALVTEALASFVAPPQPG